MKQTAWLLAAVCIALLTGCVSTQKYQQALADLESARQANEQTASAFDAYKTRAQKIQEDLESTIAQLRGDMDEQKQVNSQLQDERSQILLERNDLQRKAQELDDHAKDLTTRLAAEQTQVAKLRDDKQRLMAGTTTAQEEIERMQKRIGELEVEEARARDLEQRLSGRGKELLAVTERLGVLDAQARDLERQVAQRDSELARLREEMERNVASLTTERDQLLAERDSLIAERDGLVAERDGLVTSLETKEDRLRAEAAEKARLERERQAKEEEIRRLTQTHDELKHSLEAEIAKGDIRIKQVRDRLTINMVDRVLFDSGRAFVKPAGLKVLKQMSDILKSVDDKQIRIEGHTDNVPIGVKLQDRFPTNWELSTARATSVVRYLIEKGEIDPDNISAVGYADTRPIASNDDEAGRQVNRRIEIVLYPKDLKDIASEIGASVEN